MALDYLNPRALYSPLYMCIVCPELGSMQIGEACGATYLMDINFVYFPHACTMQGWSIITRTHPWPHSRGSHAAVCLGYGGDEPQLLVTGGSSNRKYTLYDFWILDLQSMKWKEVCYTQLY